MTTTNNKASLNIELALGDLIRILVLLSIIVIASSAKAQTNNILVFVSHEDTYYSEYIVMVEALEALGYAIDVRSASTMYATSYMIPGGTDIESTANTLPGSNYATFTAQFQELFGATWDASVNSTPSNITVSGSILDVIDMSNYDALVIPGGTGATAYRVDGTYASQGGGGRLISAGTVEAVAEKLNELAIDALMNGKPLLAQCHGASLPAYWRIPGTSGPGEEAIGYSILKDGFATGYPEPATGVALSNLDITQKTDDRVTISSPHTDLNAGVDAEYKIITSRDWYPQTVSYATRALVNVLESYPTSISLSSNRSVLILHGGAVDESNCSAANPANDVPCNYGTGADLPADYVHLSTLLSSVSSRDNYSFTVNELNIIGTLPYGVNDENNILNYINNYDVVIYYKHWSTGMNDALQNAMVTYADNGGGVISLHHGLYNDLFYGSGKNVLVEQLFEAQSNSTGWGADRTTYSLVSSNYGHFITTHGIDYPEALTWSSASPLSSSNTSLSYYSAISIFDETYTNMAFEPSATFGYGLNEITPLLSNDVNTNTQSNVSGFSKLFDPSGDGTVGKVVYLQPGENRDNYAINSLFGQMIRNAVAWAAPTAASPVVLPVELGHMDIIIKPHHHVLTWETFTELNNDHFIVERKGDSGEWSPIGIVEGMGTTNSKQLYYFQDDAPLIGTNYYRLKQIDFDGGFEYSEIVFAFHQPATHELVLYPNPARNSFQVKGNLHQPASIRIINSTGKSVLQMSYKGEPIRIDHLPNGLYQVLLGDKLVVSSTLIKR